MPRLGWTMETGSIVEWIKKDGDAVKSGDVIFTVESDKAVNEIESFEGGILRIPPDSPKPGESVAIGHLLAYLVTPGEAPPFEAGAPAASPISASTPAAASSGVTNGHADRADQAAQVITARTAHGATPPISPRARRVAAAVGLDWTRLQGSGRTGRIIERDIRAAAAQVQVAHQSHVDQPQAAMPETATDARRVSPVARRMAEQLNVDLGALAAALPDKRIEKADVALAAASTAAPVAPAQPMPPLAAGIPAQEVRVPMSNVRRVIAARMANSMRTAAPVTLTTEVDATALVALRKQLKKDGEAVGRGAPSYNDLLAKLVAEALIEFPALNARIDGDEIVQSYAVHIGFAVHTERGLLVPVIRDVQMKSVRQVARESEVLIQQARAGTLPGPAMSGSTFTITNLGMYEIDAFTPIINLPECAILGVGRIVAKPVVIDVETEQVAVRQMLFLSLTFDHRVVDGAPAAQFLQRVKQYVEHPHLGLI
jgi:pyruvate dehydrogenase E2 component (dihydrolipoamide acetyltransferase)